MLYYFRGQRRSCITLRNLESGSKTILRSTRKRSNGARETEALDLESEGALTLPPTTHPGGPQSFVRYLLCSQWFFLLLSLFGST